MSRAFSNVPQWRRELWAADQYRDHTKTENKEAENRQKQEAARLRRMATARRRRALEISKNMPEPNTAPGARLTRERLMAGR